MLGHLVKPEINEMMRAGRVAELRSTLSEFSPPVLVDLIGDLPVEDMALVFRLLPRNLAADVFEYLPLEVQEQLLRGLGREQVAQILNDMAPDDRTLLLEELPAEVTKQLLSLLSSEELAVAKKLLGYPEDSVGRRMTPDYVAIHEDWTVGQALDYVRARERDSETLNVLYVVDEKGRLLDDIPIRKFLVVPLSTRVEQLMDREFFALRAVNDQETAVTAFRKYDRVALPVTDSENVLVGIVTVDDVLDMAEEEATEDIHKLGGMEALESSYLSASLPLLIRKRAGWLAVLFVGETLTASAMGIFESELEKALILALFVPLIISSGGNSGSQAATLIIRALALGEVAVSHWWQVMRREALVGLALGAVLGGIGFLRIALWSLFSDAYGPHWLPIGITVAVAVSGVVVWGTLSGSMMPLIMKWLGFDPAASSAPFVATLVDVTGVIIYFCVAAVVLRGTLL